MYEVHDGVQPLRLQIEGILYNEAKQIFFEKRLAYNATPACKTSDGFGLRLVSDCVSKQMAGSVLIAAVGFMASSGNNNSTTATSTFGAATHNVFSVPVELYFAVGLNPPPHR